MTIPTIAEEWARFRAAVISADAPPVQVIEMRIAFYAGFKSMIDTTLYLGALDEAQGAGLLEQLHIEARRFGATLLQLPTEGNYYDS